MSKNSIVLQEFIKEFLPPTGTKRKNSANELDYIHSTLDRLFIQNFGFNLTRQDVLNAFSEIEYAIYAMKGGWDSYSKDVKPSKVGNLVNHSLVYVGSGASFLYIEVSADSVRYLRKTTGAMPSKTNADKANKVNQLKDSISQFKQKVLRQK